MLNKVINRLKNPKIVMAVTAGFLLILVNFGLIGADMSAKVTEAVNTLLGIGVAIGIFADPESHNK